MMFFFKDYIDFYFMKRFKKDMKNIAMGFFFKAGLKHGKRKPTNSQPCGHPN